MPDLVVVEVPQWQGSSSPSAGLLREGAGMLAGLIPGPARVKPPLTASAGITRDGVRHAEAIVANLAAIRAALAQAGGKVVVTVGGDCGVELAPVDDVRRRYGHRLAVVWLAVVWLDAHADLNTPGSSPSGAFHGMVLRSLLGEGPAGLLARHPLAPGQVVLAGTRALDAAGHGPLAGIFCMATRPAHRRQGVASAIVGAGARWAAARGAERLYLQVEAANEPARRLYADLGFSLSHRYHYRVAGRAGPPPASRRM